MDICAGRVAIVTGAGRGLGRAIASMLARHGASVVVNDIGGAADGEGTDPSPAESVVEEIRSAGGQAIANTGDVADWEQARQMVDQAVDKFGRLDVLVNNAGILRDRMLWNLSEADFDAVVRVNLKGAFATLHHAANYWRLQSKSGAEVDGRVINMTSSAGLFGNVGQANYAPAKAGVAAMTLVAALELKRIGVTANAIAPRAETRLTEGLIERTAEERERRDPGFVATLATWLASADSRTVTGRFFEAWGQGYTVLEGVRHGPQTEASIDDPGALGTRIREIVAAAQKPQHFDRGLYHDL